jgi:hypothetical protein
VKEEPLARAHRNLDAFVVRARRVAAHSLAQDRDALKRLADDTVEVGLDPSTGVGVALRRSYPPEEVVESAAARVRPIILEGEDCNYRKALSALGLMLKDLDPRYGRDIKAIREQWDSRVRRDMVDTDSAPTVYVANDATGESGRLNSVELGLAWIYGDVVHHDRDRRHESHIFGLRERFSAAVPLVAFTMLSTLTLLDSIRVLHGAQQIHVAESALTEPVVLESTTFTQRAKIYFAPADTPTPPDARTPLGHEWELVHPDAAAPDGHGDAPGDGQGTTS